MKLGLLVGHSPQQFNELVPSLTSPTDTGNTVLSWLYLLFLSLLSLLSSLQVAKLLHSVSDRSTAVPWYRDLEQANEHGWSAVYRLILNTRHDRHEAGIHVCISCQTSSRALWHHFLPTGNPSSAQESFRISSLLSEMCLWVLTSTSSQHW